MGRRILTTIPNPTTTKSDYTFLLNMTQTGQEALHNSSNLTLGIENSWTIWTSRIFNAYTAGLGFCEFKNSGNSNDNIEILMISGGFRVNLFNSAGTQFKNYSYNYTFEAERWISIAISWDGTTLTAYYNGAAIPATTVTTDNAGTMGTAARTVNSGLQGSNVDPSSSWAGLALWNTALSADNMAYLTDPDNIMTDWKRDEETYTGSANLVHQWRPVPARGSQSGTTYVADDIPNSGIDISSSAVNMSDDDRTTSQWDLPYKSTENHSITFDGSSQYIRTTTAGTIGVATLFTLKITAKSFRDTADETLFHCAPAAGNTNGIKIEKRGASANDPMVISVWSSAAVLLKEYHYNNALPANQWRTYTIVWEQTGDTLTVYDSTGTVVTASSKPTDGAGSTGISARHIALGATVDGTAFFSGRIREVALWGLRLTASVVPDIAAPCVNLFKLGTNYTSAFQSGLTRWLLVGRPSPSAYRAVNGNDYIFDHGDNATDLMFDGGSGVSAADINVTDSPLG